MQKLKALVILLCLLVSLFIGQTAYGFSVDPARVELTIAPGRQKGVMLSVDNSQSDEPLHIKAYLTDIVYLSSGDYDFPPAGSALHSSANWIKIIPDELDVPAKKKGFVRVGVSVPAEAKGGYYAMLFFESSPSYESSGLGINFRIGALVDVKVAGTESRKAELSNIAFIEPKRIEVEVLNQGNVLIRPKGKIKILDAQGKKRIKQFDFNPQLQSILPDALRKFWTEIEEPLLPGAYRIKAEIDYGTKYLLVGELPIEVK